MLKRERCSIKPKESIVPNTEYGPFIEGYTNTRDPYNWKSLWLLLFPIVGWIVVPILLLTMLLERLLTTKHYVFIFERGVVWKSKSFYGSENVVSFSYEEVLGVRLSRELNYTSFYGLFRKYARTDVRFEILSKNRNVILKKRFYYQNEKEVAEEYNALGFATYKIAAMSDKHVVDLLNTELANCGYCTFYTIKGHSIVPVEVGKGFIKYDGNYANANLQYAFQNGLLVIYPSEEDCNYSSKNRFSIDVNNMFNNNLFLGTVSQFLGIQ